MHPHYIPEWRDKHGKKTTKKRLWTKVWWGHSVWPRLWQSVDNWIMCLHCGSGELMEKTYRVLTLLLLSITIAASAILFTVGLDHEHLGPERKWTYPLFFVLIPAFVLQTGIRYVFRRKPDSKNSDQWLNKWCDILKKTDAKPKDSEPK